MADGYLCRVCSKVVSATKNNRYRTHKDSSGEACITSSAEIPDDLLQQAPSDTKSAGVPEEGKDFAKCPQCGRNVKLTRLGYFPKHDTTLYGGEQCSTTGVRAFHAGKTTDLPLPGDEIPTKGVNRALAPKVTNQKEYEESKPKGVPLALTASAEPTPPPGSTAPGTDAGGVELPPGPDAVDWSDVTPGPDEDEQRSSEMPSPESTSTSDASPAPELAPFRLGRTFSKTVRQPDSPFLQPPEYREPSPVFLQPPEYAGPEKPEPMGDLAKELSVRIKETFYAYDNRKTKDNRSAQTTLGPSEIGTPCDRRLAMALMGIPPVNPGGDGWAAFVGTCGHVGMAEMLTFADAGTGRYAVELPLTFQSVWVPRGTTDALDRRDATLIDWKFMGAYSLKKFKLEGPSTTYRVQAHTYGLGATEAGEKVRNVAIVGLPRAGGSLDDMHVWTEKFDPKVGRAALARVESIAQQINVLSGRAVEEGGDRMSAAATFDTANDCRYCPFHLKTDKEMRRGCPGM